MNQIDLRGRAAVITGGGSGIGLASAKRFLQSGARVEIWGRNANKLREAAEGLSDLGDIGVREVNVASESAVDQAAAVAIQRFGKVDILFNCAGVQGPLNPLVQVSSAAWRETFATNVDGTFYCCRAFIPGMQRNSYGRVINCASMAGKEGNANQAAYSAAKAGVIAMTKSLGKELAATGVVVNGIAPTLFDTPLMRNTVDTAPDVSAQLLARIPMARMGHVDEAAAMVAWLASSECSFSTGFTFDLSGGRATY